MSLCGTQNEHCCWLNGIECQYLVASQDPGFVWACGLREELGDWNSVYADQRYVDNIQPFWDSYPQQGLACGQWPKVGNVCNSCGQNK